MRAPEVAKDWPQHKRAECTGTWVYWTPMKTMVGCRTCGAVEILTPQMRELLALEGIVP